MRHRRGLFEVIELWIENRVLIELLPPTIASGYLAFMEPDVKAILCRESCNR